MKLADCSCVVGMCVSESEVEFAGFLDFAPEGEDGFGRWSVGWEGKREAL